jgi:hypothetical protein
MAGCPRRPLAQRRREATGGEVVGRGDLVCGRRRQRRRHPTLVASPCMPEIPDSTGSIRSRARSENLAKPVPRPARSHLYPLPQTTSAASQSASTTPKP